MEPDRFDALVQTLTRSGSRRRALGLLLATVLAPATAAASPAPAGCLAAGKRCSQPTSSGAARARSQRKKGKHHPASCAKCCSGLGIAATDGKSYCACKGEGVACDNAGQCCGGECRNGNCTGCPGDTVFCTDSCADLQTNDRHCGSCDVSCDAGQLCVNGSCVCDGTSCGTGCCAGTTCKRGDNANACGTGGAACQTCDPGQRCGASGCVCDATSCPNGCCAGTTCVPFAEQSDTQCGSGGVSCQDCGGDKRCFGGTCQATCAAVYGASACETPTTVCGPDIVTCGGNPNCWAMPTTGGCCACSGSPGRFHQTCVRDADCVVAAKCEPGLGRCIGDSGLRCTSDSDCASLRVCRDGECGGPICTTDDDCAAVVGPGTVCISGAALPCTAGGANVCWTLCAGA